MKRLGRKGLSILLVLLSVLSVTLLSSCGGTASQNTATSDEVGSYEYVFRTIGEQKYITPAESFAGGDGTEENPYQISNASELAYLSELINGEYSTERTAYQKAYYMLTDDIVLNEHPDSEDWSKTAPEYAWLPIGLHRWFEGSFNGDNHTITGMYINEDVSDYDDYNASYGLFGENIGTIKNLSVEKSYLCVSGYTSNIGGIAGENSLENARIENCNVEAELYCYDAGCGGIVGNHLGGTVTGCTFNGSVTCLRDYAVSSFIGGISGHGSGTIGSCQNNGSIFAGADVESCGGITGSGGSIENCINNGTVKGGKTPGGIAGNASSIINCVNNGDVSAESGNAGGIVGSVGVDYSEETRTISNCENNGNISASDKIGGIIGSVFLRGKGSIAVSDCVNTVDLNGNVVGGIIGSASELFGNLTVTGCENNGKITGELYAAGIIAENNLMTWAEEKHNPLNVTIASSKNTGKINTVRGGGVAGVFVNSIPAEYSDRVSVVLDGNINDADIHCMTDSSFVGGIAGNVGLANAAITVKDCVSSGTISFEDHGVDDETTGIEEKRIELSRIGGGIVGMIEDGIFLSTTNDGVTGVNVNVPDAKIVFSNCQGDMKFDAPSEDKYTYDNDGEPVFLNRFGGIIGFCTDMDGYAFLVENCTYTNCDCGLGIKELPDVGTKSNETHITAKIQNLY